ncbi:GDSL-type esterase/lipase family protein [Lysobacter fragariae]
MPSPRKTPRKRTARVAPRTGGKSTTNSAAAVGRDLAEQTLKRRAQAAARRAVALGKAMPKPARGAVKMGGGHAGATSRGVVIAEGDSWFDYPFHDVLKELEDDYAYDVESVAHKGDRLEDMAYSSGQLEDFARRIQKVMRSGVTPKAILISGGGNDIAGDEFAILLNHAASPIAGLNESIVTGVIDQRLLDALVTMLTSVTKVCEGLIGKTVPIVLHGYDYPVPDGRGFMGGFWVLPGPWLEPGFREKGYAQMVTRVDLIKRLIDRFNTMLKAVTARPEFAHVEYLDLRGTLSGGTNYKQWWANELHPTEKGFAAVTKKFAALID